MNPDLNLLHPYPFERQRLLFGNTPPNPAYKPISLGLGEPRHPTPQFIKDALVAALGGLASYPGTLGIPALRAAMAGWLQRRYGLPAVNADTEVLPVNGSREALFSFAQTIIDRRQPRPRVVCPNPFYQIYEGATLLAGATPLYANVDPARNFVVNYDNIDAATWADVQLVYVCSPGNPTGAVMNLEDWRQLFELSDRYGFVIASDECYSEIYFRDEAPLGGLDAAHKLGRSFERLVIFTSLSKRSNVPGMRSGFVAGDPAILAKFLLYRTYHGSALGPAIQSASIPAWNDEAHVIENRSLYRQKFAQVTPVLQQVLSVKLPDAAFYLWAKTPISDVEFTRRLYAEYNVAVLPGSYLAREQDGINPGANHIRIALVAEVEECLEAAQRIVSFVNGL